MENYEEQSYRSWSNDCDEMDGGSEGNGCMIPIFLLLFIVIIILSSYYSEEEIEVKPKTECICTQNK